MLSGVIKEYDTTSNKWIVKIAGTGFTGTSATTEFIVHGRPQVIKSQTATELVVEVSNVTDLAFGTPELYFDVGTPIGKSVL